MIYNAWARFTLIMDHLHTGKLWNENAEAWTALSRAGYDVYRDHLNTPAFLSMLPDVAGLRGLDVGCGEGHNTRLLAVRGARMTGLDIAGGFLRHARASELADPLSIEYVQGSGLALPFFSETFDFVVAFMSLMDMPETQNALNEIQRILKPGGFFQFSISHPCSDVRIRRKVKDEAGKDIAIELGGYFQRIAGEVEEWTFGSAPPELRERWPPFRVPRYTHTLSDWLNMVIAAGLTLEEIAEPEPDDEAIERCPQIADARVWPYFLIIRARKSA